MPDPAIPSLVILIFVCILIGIMAFLYASVGHGGASGYLAVMALCSISPAVMKPSALILNVMVSFISFYNYRKTGAFKWQMFWPFALGSVPASYFGATIPLTDDYYKKILGLALILAIIRILMPKKVDESPTKAPNLLLSLCIGAGIGLLSGMIGIGGGIILSPIILLLHWGNMKETAAVSSLFIFVNSIAGLIGLYSKPIVLVPEIYAWIGIAFLGGLAGSYFGALYLNQMALKRILAIVLFIACAKLILT